MQQSSVNTKRLDKQLYLYKHQELDSQKNQQFQTIVEILTNHIRQIKMYLLGYQDESVSKEVAKFMLSNMMCTSTIKDEQEFLNILRQNVKLAGFSVEDVEQLIMLELIKLIDSFTYEKITFFQYVTYLLPRRIQQYFWTYSKDQMNQMYTIREQTETQEFDEYLYKYTSNSEEYNLTQKIAISKSDMHEHIAYNEHKLNKQIQHQIIKHKKRMK